MNKVYIIYTDFGYDGICIEGVATDMDKAREIALVADMKCHNEVVIELWDVNRYVPMINRGNDYIAMVIKNGVVQEDKCHTKK